MSSTNRGATRQKDDFYETPAWATRLILPKLLMIWDSKNKVVLDPFAGRGAILDVVRSTPELDGCRTLGIELDPDRAKTCQFSGNEVTCGDAFAQPLPLAHAIITNPPYSRALEAVEMCVEWVETCKHHKNFIPQAAVLLRLSFLASLERASFHRKHPADVFVLARRPSFLTSEQKKQLHAEALESWRAGGEAGKRPSPPGTDSCEYAWFVWGLDGGRWQVLT